jgi:hypothetical protein
MENGYGKKIEQLLSPLVGEFIAKMAVKSQCKSIGITPDNIQQQNLETLSKKIGDALAFHGHKDEANKIVAAIKNMT